MASLNLQPVQISTEELTPYNVDGLELFFTSNRKVRASQSAIARMCEVTETTVRNDLKTLEANGAELDVYYAQGRSATESSRSKLHNSSTIKILLKKRNPALLEQFLDFGIDEGLAQMAGVPIQSTPAPQQPLTAFEYASLYVEAEKGRLALAAQIEKDKSATDLGKLIDKAEGNISMGEYAKAIGTGRQRLFDQLREQKIIMPLPLNTPYQNHLEAKRFVVTEKVTEQGHVFAVTLITPKGQTYLAKKHLEYQNREKITVMVEKELELV